MTSIVGKRQGSKTYYHAVESARVDGKPRIVSQTYLGSAEEVLAKLAGRSRGEPARVHAAAFGAVASAWAVAEDLRIAAIVDQVVKPRADAKVTAGRFIQLAAVGKAVAPCSKDAFADWWERTAAPRFTRISAKRLDGRRFGDAMGRLGADRCPEVEERIAAHALRAERVDPSALVLDMTNFAAYVSSANPKAPIAQRGKAKQKRKDLRLVGLGLVATEDGAIPVLSHPYPGDKPDVTQFPKMVERLAERYSCLGDPGSLTVTWDAGQNSEDDQAVVEHAEFGFVTSLPPANCQDLLDIPASRFKALDPERHPKVRFHERKAYRALGAAGRVLVTFSPTLREAQERGFAQTLAKAGAKLADVQAVLERGRARHARPQLEAKIAQILSDRQAAQVTDWDIAGDEPPNLRLAYQVDDDKIKALADREFGKRVLFTNRRQWEPARVVAAYRSQHLVEASFKQMKDPARVAFSPMWHWTQDKIKVHCLIEVLALLIAHVMRRRAHQAGLEMSYDAICSQLDRVEEVTMLYPKDGKGRPVAKKMLTETTPLQRRLLALYGADKLAPTR
ncbi:MAG: IS1634 family transposase [Bifidobacteriaceae bacterium]|jgi:transposase|nr:IS1634 family transposase [Bifidobacteriaceae bacterium]